MSWEVTRDVSRKLQLTLCGDNGVVKVSLVTACLMVKLRFRLGLVNAKPLAHSTARWNIDRNYM